MMNIESERNKMPNTTDSEFGVVVAGKASDVFAWLQRVSDRNPGMTLKEWLMMGR